MCNRKKSRKLYIRASYFHRLREPIMYKIRQEENDICEGEIEVDESYFGGAQKGKRSRGAARKVHVFRF